MEKSGAKDLVIYSFSVVFANDGIIDEHELAMMQRLAMEDGVIDEKEKEVLRNIFSRASREKMDPQVWQDIEAWRQKNDI